MSTSTPSPEKNNTTPSEPVTASVVTPSTPPVDYGVHYITLLYTLAVEAYIEAYYKTYQDIQNSPSGNGLFAEFTIDKVYGFDTRGGGGSLSAIAHEVNKENSAAAKDFIAGLNASSKDKDQLLSAIEPAEPEPTSPSDVHLEEPEPEESTNNP